MSPIIIGIMAFIVLFTLLAFGLPIGFGMALVGFLGFGYLVSIGAAVAKMGFIPFETVSSYDMAVLPLFLLMAQVTFVTGLGKDLYNLASKWLGHQPGGLAMATTGACAGFSAVSASSMATAATMGLVALPEMEKYRYDPALATGCVAAGGTMGVLIPPSAGLILYGILTEQSIGTLFLAGIIPGILEAVFYIATIYILCLWKPSLGPRGPRVPFKEKLLAFKDCGEIIGLVILILGGLFAGLVTPTEAGAVGAFGAIGFSLFRKRLTWSKLGKACIETVRMAGMIYFIMIGAFIFNYFLAVTTIPTWLAEVIEGLPLPPLAIILLIMMVYLVLGCFMDTLAMILLTIPIFYPLVVGLGFNPIWFGVIMVRMTEIAMITPPIGMNVYIIAGVAPEVPMQTIFKGIFPFLIADTLHVTLLLAVPQVVLFLPSIM